MKSKFLGHFKLNDDQVKEIWANGVFVFDANTLLNMYRYSDTTRDALFSQFERIKERVWLPHQAGVEFFRNRISVIADQKKTYDDMKRELTSIKRQFSTERGHPFISADSAIELEGTITKIEQELDASGQTIEQRMTQDEVLDRLAKIFDQRLGNEFDEDTMKALFEEGEDRYNRKVPPGYMDASKVKDPQTSDDKWRLYGDFVLWRQTLEMAKAEDKHVVFVTDDRKEDWWLEKSGKTISPRPELIAEFNKFTGNHVKFYTPDSFVAVASDYIGGKISEGAIDEVRAAETAKQEDALANYAVGRRKRNGLENMSDRERERFLYDRESERPLRYRRNALAHGTHIADDDRSRMISYADIERFGQYRDDIFTETINDVERRRSALRSKKIRELRMEMSAALEAKEYAQRKLEQSSTHDRRELIQDLIKANRLVDVLENRLTEISNLFPHHEAEE